MDLKLWMSPLTHNIYVGRIGKTGDTLEKHDVTQEAINIVAHLIEEAGPIELKKDGEPVKTMVFDDGAHLRDLQLLRASLPTMIRNTPHSCQTEEHCCALHAAHKAAAEKVEEYIQKMIDKLEKGE